MDPLALRLLNYSERDAIDDKPFTSKELRACYDAGAERFGWRGAAAPRSMSEGHELVGWGMATGIWDALLHVDARARRATADGRLRSRSATADIGTGTYTVMAQIASETIGLPLDGRQVRARRQPPADSAGRRRLVDGSVVGAAVQAGLPSLRAKLCELRGEIERLAARQGRVRRRRVRATARIRLAAKPRGRSR